MGQVYFVRHGQTIWNVENKICGATDIALTDPFRLSLVPSLKVKIQAAL